MEEKKNDGSKVGFEETEVMNLKIYDVPTALAKELLLYAKEECGNKGWVAIKQLLEYRKIHEQIVLLEARVQALEMEPIKKEEEQPKVRTFG